MYKRLSKPFVQEVISAVLTILNGALGIKKPPAIWVPLYPLQLFDIFQLQYESVF